MKTRFLFPNRFKKIGWIVLGLAIIMYFTGDSSFPFIENLKMLSLNFNGQFKIIETDLNITILCTLFIVGLLLISFSKTKKEDEYISRLRLESLMWAIYFNYLLLLVATILIYDTDYFDILCFNIVTPLLLFIIRFHILLIKTQKSAKHEK